MANLLYVRIHSDTSVRCHSVPSHSPFAPCRFPEAWYHQGTGIGGGGGNCGKPGGVGGGGGCHQWHPVVIKAIIVTTRNM